MTSGRASGRRSASAVAMVVSVPIGRGGPCCSVAPSGTASSVDDATSATSGQVRSTRWRAGMLARRSAGLAAEADRRAVVGPTFDDGVSRDTGQRELAVALHALGVGRVARQPGEERGRHATALAGVELAAPGPSPGGMRLLQ